MIWPEIITVQSVYPGKSIKLQLKFCIRSVKPLWRGTKKNVKILWIATNTIIHVIYFIARGIFRIIWYIWNVWNLNMRFGSFSNNANVFKNGLYFDRMTESQLGKLSPRLAKTFLMNFINSFTWNALRAIKIDSMIDNVKQFQICVQQEEPLICLYSSITLQKIRYIIWDTFDIKTLAVFWLNKKMNKIKHFFL